MTNTTIQQQGSRLTSSIWLETPDWLFVPVAPGHAQPVARLHARNGLNFSMAMSLEPGMESPDYWEPVLRAQQEAASAGSAVHLVGFAKSAPDLGVACTLSFGGIVKEDFQACSVGFKLDCSLEGRGLMYAALEPAIRRMLELHGLHRIMATHLPQNVRCARLLRKLGFSVEGYARDFIFMNGAWADVVLLSYLASESRRETSA
jgi:ribosomal-protein-alanine N-acetyltransferase